MLRHSRATLWLREDHLSPETVSRLLGHASTQTTYATYLHLTKEDLRKALTRGKEEEHESDPD
jgi:integrase